MGRYVKWDDVVRRYPMFADLGDDAETDEAWITKAEATVEGVLAGYFTTPFSDNNVTAVDLCIDLSAAKALAYKDPEKAELILTSVNSTMMALKSGEMAMMTTSGDPIYAAAGAWSETKGYQPIFDLGPVEDWEIDPDQLDDLEADKS